jgi:hypothetical protein
MKKYTLSALTILIAIVSFSTSIQPLSIQSTIIQPDSNPFKAHHHKQKNKSGFINFTPDDAFGGIDAKGKYKKKGKTATILYDQTVYLFNKIVEDPNPRLHKNKLNLVTLGFFSDHTNSANMPVTTYVFGSPINDAAKKIAQAIPQNLKSIQQEQSENEDSIENDKAIDSLQFKPSKEFAGHDLVGTYLNNTHEATINDPSGKNKKSYVFENVQEGLPISLTSNNVRPLQKPILIGSYSSTPQCSNGTPQICSNAIMHTDLYGNLKQ